MNDLDLSYYLDLYSPSHFPTSLDPQCHNSPLILSTKPNKKEWTRKQKRCYHRAMSGLEVACALNEQVRFLTLTSSPESPSDIHKSFSKFVKRVRRKYGKFEYIAVKEKTKSGLIHLHILYRGSYMDQEWISKTWEEIHKAPVVWIEHVDLKRMKKSKIAAYLVKYLAKDPLGRYWCSWNWVFKGFVKFWKSVIQHYGYSQKTLVLWRNFLHGKSILYNHFFFNGKLVKLRIFSAYSLDFHIII